MTSAAQYAPGFVISINNADLRQTGVDIMSVSVTDLSQGADSFNFTVRGKHRDRGHFAGGAKIEWLDDKLFDEGTPVKIQLGYVNHLTFEFWGLITATSPNFPESGTPTLTVRGFSLYYKLQHQQRSKPFESASDSDIAEKCAAEVGLKAQVDKTTVKYPLVSAHNQTYAALLSQRAQRLGYECTVKHDVLYFQQPRYQVERKPVISLEWGKSLRSFTPSLSLYDMVTEVEVRGAQTSLGQGKAPLVGTAKAGTERAILGQQSGSQIALKAKINRRVVANDPAVQNQQEAGDLAKAQLENRSINFISGRGSCIGEPTLTARSVIELLGLGERFSGQYYVISATHTLDAGGYRTDFEVRRNGR